MDTSEYESRVWLGHIKLEMPVKIPNGDVKHMIGDEVRLGDIKLEFTSA